MFSGLRRLVLAPGFVQTRGKSTEEYRTGFEQPVIDNYYKLFDQFDRDRDDHLSSAELNDVIGHWIGRRVMGGALLQIFYQYDTNRDDKVSFTEFLDHLGKRNSSEYTDLDVRRMFRMWSKGLDNRIQFREVQQAMVYLGQAAESPDLMILLKRLDADRDGALEYQQFKQLMKDEVKKIGKITSHL